MPGLTHELAYPTLRGRLALRELDGEDPLTLLLDAAQTHELDNAVNRAAILGWRLSATEEDLPGPLPWLPALPDRLAATPSWVRI
jgi:hypothetical protein